MRRLRWLHEWFLYALYVGLGGSPDNPGTYIDPPTRATLRKEA